MNNNITLQTANQTPLFQAVYKIYVSWHNRCEHIPKKDRFTVGQKTEGLLLEILIAIVTAYHTKDVVTKREILSKANISLECTKIIVRLAKDIQAIDKNSYLDYEGRFQEIGKMIGGWMQSLHKTNR